MKKSIQKKSKKITGYHSHHSYGENELNIIKQIHELEERINTLSNIGLGLSREKDRNKLLEMILKEAKTLSNADGGTLYMKDDKNQLRFEIIITDSLNFHMGGTSGKEIPFEPLKLFDDEGLPEVNMIAPYVAISGKTINIPDAYFARGFDFSGTRAFDKKTGYRSKSFLTVPLKDHEDKIIGVLQLLNARNEDFSEIITFNSKVQKMVEALASEAAVIITNKNLIRDLEVLFESFIKLIASAIDKKSPYTGGHCQRVPVITMELAKAVNEVSYGKYSHTFFTEKELYELKIASWLHDAGKVAIPEYVVDKGTKLETIYDRIHIIESRVEILKRDAENTFLKEKIRLYESQIIDNSELKERLTLLNNKYLEDIKRLNEEFEFLREVNRGGEYLAEDKIEHIENLARYSFMKNGEKIPLLSENEVANLTIKKGTLTSDERDIINSHVSVSIEMLEQLPYPKHLKNVPEIAGGHHEKMDGTGYPRGLTGDQMSVQAKIMAIADIFEALTARDRPYKKGKKLSEAMGILKMMKDEAHIDPDLFEIFVKEEIYKEYALKYLNPDQIDTFDAVL